MTNELLKLFLTEYDLRSYAKVNGYDSGAIDKLVSRWSAINAEEVPEDIINTVKQSFVIEQDIQTKNEY